MTGLLDIAMHTMPCFLNNHCTLLHCRCSSTATEYLWRPFRTMSTCTCPLVLTGFMRSLEIAGRCASAWLSKANSNRQALACSVAGVALVWSSHQQTTDQRPLFIIYVIFCRSALSTPYAQSRGAPMWTWSPIRYASAYLILSAVVLSVTWLILHHAGCKWMSVTQSRLLFSCFVSMAMLNATGSNSCCWLLTQLSCSIHAALSDAAEPSLTTSPRTVERAKTRVPSWRSGLSWSKTTCGSSWIPWLLTPLLIPRYHAVSHHYSLTISVMFVWTAADKFGQCKDLNLPACMMSDHVISS